MSRVAQRAGNVTASTEGRQPCSQGCSLAARRATRRARRIPWIVRRAVNLVVALRIREHEGHVCFAIDDGAGLQQAIDQEGILRGDVVLPKWVAEGRRQAL